MTSTYSEPGQPRKIASPALLIGGGMLATLDIFVVIVALPSIRESYPDVSPDGSLWAAVAFPLVSAILLIPMGGVATRVGRGRVFVAGLVVFAGGSVLAGLAPMLWLLVVGRAVQGVGAAALIPTSLALLIAGRSAQSRQRAIVAWAAAGSFAAAVGPILGGLLVPFDWRIIFLFNTALAAPLLWGARRLDLHRGADGRWPNVTGSALFGGALIALMVALSNVGVAGSTAVVWGAAALGFSLFVLLVVRVRRRSRPEVMLFRDASFRVALVGTLVFYLGFAVLIAGMAQALTQAWKLDPPLVGVAFAIGPLSALASSLTIGRASISAGCLTVLSGVSFALGATWWLLMFSSGHPTLVGYLPGVVLLGIGVGNAQSALLNGGTLRLTDERRAVATPLLNTVRQAGTALGIGLFIAIAIQVGVGSLTDFTWAWVVLIVTGLALAASGALFEPLGAGGGGRRVITAER